MLHFWDIQQLETVLHCLSHCFKASSTSFNYQNTCRGFSLEPMAKMYSCGCTCLSTEWGIVHLSTYVSTLSTHAALWYELRLVFDSHQKPPLVEHHSLGARGRLLQKKCCTCNVFKLNFESSVKQPLKYYQNMCIVYTCMVGVCRWKISVVLKTATLSCNLFMCSFSTVL